MGGRSVVLPPIVNEAVSDRDGFDEVVFDRLDSAYAAAHGQHDQEDCNAKDDGNYRGRLLGGRVYRWRHLSRTGIVHGFRLSRMAGWMLSRLTPPYYYTKGRRERQEFGLAPLTEEGRRVIINQLLSTSQTRSIQRHSSVNLFHCADAKPETVPAPATLQTPLGVVRLDAILDGLNVAEEPPTQTYRLPSGGWAACWHQPDFDLELLLCHPVLSLPPGMPLTDGWAALWRLRARATIASSTFVAIWEKGYTWTRGGPDSSEWLYAKAWDDGQTEVYIVTGDERALAAQSRRGDGLPQEWEPYFLPTADNFDWFFLQMVHYEVGDRGIPIPLPPLEPGQQCQVHFNLSWFPEGEDGRLELSAKQALTGAGCS